MVYAVIDMGSNTMRLSVIDYSGKEMFKLFSRKEMAGLINYIQQGAISQEGLDKACEILNDFKSASSKYVKPQDIMLLATASLRNLRNSREAIDFIVENTGLRPDILSGQEEARMSFIGTALYTGCQSGIMADIGGASTELVYFQEGEIKDLTSLPLGCLNLSLQYIREVLPNTEERQSIRSAVMSRLSPINWTPPQSSRVLVVTGGTVRAVQKLARVILGENNSSSMSLCRVLELMHVLESNEYRIYQTVNKTIPERLLTINTGLIILCQIAGHFGIEDIRISKYGVREGYLMDRVNNKNDTGTAGK